VSICKEELISMLEEEELKDAALCILANKQEYVPFLLATR
jgi:hypothetical protein